MVSPVAAVRPGRISRRRQRRRLEVLAAALLVAGLIMVLTSGCVPTALMAGLSLAGGPTSLAAAGTKAPYAGRGETVQNGRADPAAVEALRTSDREVTTECRAEVEKARAASVEIEEARGVQEAGSGTGETTVACRLEPVCLPGFRRPTVLRLCEAAPRCSLAPCGASPAAFVAGEPS